MDGQDPWPDPLEEPADPTAPGRVTSPEPIQSPSTYRRRAGRLILVAVGVAIVVRITIGVWAVASTPGIARGALREFVASSAFFIGVPALLAWVLVWRRPPESAMGRVMVGTTVGLLLAAMVLGEGAICVLFAAPLAYAVAAVVVVAGRWWTHRHGTAAVLAVALLPLLPGQPSDVVRSVHVSRVVPMDVAAVADRIDAGPDLGTDPDAWLLTLGYPLPTSVDVRRTPDAVIWSYPYGRGRTTFRMTTTTNGYQFQALEDTAMSRWFSWDGAALTTTPVDGGTRLDLELRFDPAIGPDWWFGTIEGRILAAAGDHLLDTLGLEGRS